VSRTGENSKRVAVASTCAVSAVYGLRRYSAPAPAPVNVWVHRDRHLVALKERIAVE